MNTVQDSQANVLYFVYVPKCAGTSVEEHLIEHLPAAQIMRPKKSMPIVRYATGKAWRTPEHLGAAQVRVLCGHFFGRACGDLLPPHKRLEAILIRDPVGLFLSWYNYRMTRHGRWGRVIPTFEEWYRSQGRNVVARHLLTRHLGWSEFRFVTASRREIMEEACRALDTFWFVGEYRHVGKLMAAITTVLGTPQDAERRNITTYQFLAREDMSEATAAMIRADNAIDQFLFDRYRDRQFDPAAAVAIVEPSGDARLLAAEMRRLAVWSSIRLQALAPGRWLARR